MGSSGEIWVEASEVFFETGESFSWLLIQGSFMVGKSFSLVLVEESTIAKEYSSLVLGADSLVLETVVGVWGRDSEIVSKSLKIMQKIPR